MTDPSLLLKVAKYTNGANCHRINQLLTCYKNASFIKGPLTEEIKEVLEESEKLLRIFIYEEEKKELEKINPYKISSNKRFI